MPARDNIAALLSSVRTENVNPFATVGQFANQQLQRMDQQKDREERAKNRAEDVLFRQQQADRAQANADRSYLLQEAQDKRAGTEFDRKLMGQNMTAHVDAATADVMNRGALTQQGQTKLLSEYDKMVKAGIDPQEAGVRIGAMYDTNQGGIRKVPMTTKDKIAAVEGINLGSGELQYDPTMALGQKDKLLTSLRSQYENELNRAQQMDLTKMKIAADAREGAKNRAAAKERSVQAQPMKMSKILPDGRIQEINVYTPDQVRAAQADKFMLGEVGGSYRPGGDKSVDKSVYASPRAQLLSDKWGSYDAPKILGMAETLRKANPKMSADTALGIVEDVASNGWTDAVSVYDVNERAADLGYTGKLLKK